MMPSDVGSPDIEASVHSGSPSAVRRARKRATDRKSQRNHRERQRAYIQDLERTVAALKSASNTDETVSALLAENESFRKRCGVLASQISRIRTIAAETGVDQGHRPPTSCPVEAVSESFEISIEGPQSSPSDQIEDIPEVTAGPFLDTSHPLLSLADEGLNHVTDPFTFSDAFRIDTRGLSSDLALISTGQISLMDGSLRLSSPNLPMYGRPQGAGDRLLHAMLDEAIAEHEAGRFDTSEPSLRRLLSGGPADILSFRIFHYIKSWGAMPMHWLLATFWVQYLFMRWNVLRTAESYARVPHFLRPTALECTVPHRICINMLVWPDIRQALITDALTVDSEAVSIELLKNLSPHWPVSFAMTGDLVATMDVYQMIETQAVRFDFWKVEPGFLQTYPRYKSCNLNNGQWDS